MRGWDCEGSLDVEKVDISHRRGTKMNGVNLGFIACGRKGNRKIESYVG